jgi:outer membrane protein
MMTRLALAAALGLLLVGCGHAAQPAQHARLGFVDYQRVLMEVEDGKAAKARLQQWLEERQKEIDTEQELLRKEKEQLEKQASTMSEDARAQRAADLQKRILELGQKWERYRAEAGQRERKELDPIVRRTDKVVEQVADQGGFALVFDRNNSGLVYGRTTYDLSDEVIRAYGSQRQ